MSINHLHIAIIMDGNRRYAKKRGLSVDEGHRRGADKIEEILDWCIELKIKELTLYTFSTENFRRKKEEVNFL
ncbi:MAG: undecaprenyl diphosphate synthase family protein, partial [Candidatus Woesearchaeota archaeon]|nr:undecaprenyl diphosphate synthase family protein [Candidatus Woesearchaeota archaeon]